MTELCKCGKLLHHRGGCPGCKHPRILPPLTKEEKHERYRKIMSMASKRSTEQARQVYKDILELLGNKCSNPYNLPHPDWCNDTACLQIDHINDNGYKERKEFGSCRNMRYKYILEKIKSGSKDYQLLCANCNWIKRRKKENQKLN